MACAATAGTAGYPGTRFRRGEPGRVGPVPHRRRSLAVRAGHVLRYARGVGALAVQLESGTRRHVLRVRATDDRGNTQPESTSWNELGYLHHSVLAHPVHVESIRARRTKDVNR